MTLAAKTIVSLAVTVAAALALPCVLLLHEYEESLKRTLSDRVDAQATLAASGIEAFLREDLREAEAIARTLPVEALQRGRLGEVEAHLERMAEVFPGFQNGLFVLDASGTFLVDHPPHPQLRGESLAFREYYQRTIHGDAGVVGTPYRSKRTGRPVLTVTAPVRDAGRRIVAIVACSVDLLSEHALGGYAAQRIGKTGYLYAFDRSRLLLLHPDPARLLTQVEPGRNEILEAARDGFEGLGMTVNSKGVPMLIAVRRIPGTGWMVAVQVTQEEVYAPVAAARRRILFVAGVSVFLAIVIGSFAVRRVSTPLRRLERVASGIRAQLEATERTGEYHLPQSLVRDLEGMSSGDEIGSLASSFSRLTARLTLTLGSLRRSAEEWRRTFNSVDQAIVLLSRDGRIVIMNGTAEKWFGVSLDSARGQCAHAVIFGGESAPRVWPDVASLDGQQRARWSCGLERPRGTFEFTMTAVPGPEGSSAAVLVVNDVTDRIALELELRQSQKLEAVGRLAAGVAHEINTPIQFIGDNTTFLKEAFAELSRILPKYAEAARPEAREALAQLEQDADLPYLREHVPTTIDRTLQGVQRVATIVGAMKEFAHPEQRAMAPADLNRAIHATLEVARNEYKYVAEVETDLGDIPLVTCQIGDLNQVVLNVVVNAAHAIADVVKGTESKGKIRVGTRRVGGDVVVSIADTGTGIPDAVRDRVFDPFFTTKEVGRGTGQGLAIARNIVAKHQGSMSFESEVGKGTTFLIRVPIGGPSSRALAS